ncbi:MAG: restriction endonuclease [Phycisphaerae bacterium]|nr:restriction endonuclease [Phycisphaerae bacterium]
MNHWTALSIEYANQRNYLDDLFKIYPCIPEGIRDIDQKKWQAIEKAFKKRDNSELLKTLLSLDLFPIKDSYVAYLKRDFSALERNPQTVNRLCGRIYEMGLNNIYERCSEPKETNRQIGPLFHRWIEKKLLGVELLRPDKFLAAKDNAILRGSDKELMDFANKHLKYNGTKGLDFIARFNGKYVVGEAKFLTDFGGHQNAQFEDAKNLLKNRTITAVKLAILDGVLYIRGKNKMHEFLKKCPDTYNIMSCLVLRDFLYQI